MEYDELMDDQATTKKLREWFACTPHAKPFDGKAAEGLLVNAGEGYKVRPQPREEVGPNLSPYRHPIAGE